VRFSREKGRKVIEGKAGVLESFVLFSSFLLAIHVDPIAWCDASNLADPWKKERKTRGKKERG